MDLFIIYAREDAAEKNEIIKVIEKPLRNLGVTIWHDSNIRIGENWEEVILNQLQYSSLFLFLLSPHFFNSHFIQTVEFREACKKNAQKDALILPLLISDCSWTANPEINKLQVFPRDATPLSARSDKSKVLKQFASEIEGSVTFFMRQFEYKMKRKEEAERINNLPLNRVKTYAREELPKLEEALNDMSAKYPKAASFISWAAVMVVLIIFLAKCA